MLTRKSALRSTLAIFLCLSVTFLASGFANAQTVVINPLVAPTGGINPQGILASSGPTEVIGLDITSSAADVYSLSQVTFIVWNAGQQNEDGLDEVTPFDFASFEIWRDNDTDSQLLTRSGIFDPPGGEFPLADELIATLPVPSPDRAVESAIGPLDIVMGWMFTIDIPPGPLAEAPLENSGDFAGDDFFLVLRTSDTIDSDPRNPLGDNVDRVDDFFIAIEEESIVLTN